MGHWDFSLKTKERLHCLWVAGMEQENRVGIPEEQREKDAKKVEESLLW